MTAPRLPRMRIRHGRVMHAVEDHGSGWLRSVCRRPRGVRGLTGTEPRAIGPADWWTPRRYDYPDCTHCPPEAEPPCTTP